MPQPHRILLEDFEERYAPPSENLLSLSRVGDVIYLEIGTLEETDTVETFTTTAQVAITRDVLLHSLILLDACEGTK